jgi:hypothetical protein
LCWRDEALGAGVEGGARQIDRRGVVHLSRLLIRNAAERCGEVHDRVDAVYRLEGDVAFAQVAEDDLGARSAQWLRGATIPNDDPYGLAFSQQTWDEAAPKSPGRSAHKGAHVRLLIQEIVSRQSTTTAESLAGKRDQVHRRRCATSSLLSSRAPPS